MYAPFEKSFKMNVDRWKEHFSSMAHSRLPKGRNFYLLNENKQHGSGPVIKLVTPAQQAVEIAKSEVKQKRKRRTQSRVGGKIKRMKATGRVQSKVSRRTDKKKTKNKKVKKKQNNKKITGKSSKRQRK